MGSSFIEKLLKSITAFLAMANAAVAAVARQVANVATWSNYRAVATALVAAMITAFVILTVQQIKKLNAIRTQEVAL